jgi:hypothetical protein
MKELNSVDEVIAELGGPTAAARISALGVSAQAVSNWRMRKRLPAEKYLVVSSELRQRGFSAPASLFGIPGGGVD